MAGDFSRSRPPWTAPTWRETWTVSPRPTGPAEPKLYEGIDFEGLCAQVADVKDCAAKIYCVAEEAPGADSAATSHANSGNENITFLDDPRGHARLPTQCLGVSANEVVRMVHPPV